MPDRQRSRVLPDLEEMRAFSAHPDFYYLDQFMGGYFHQDFDLVADSIEGLVGAFVRDCTPQPELIDVTAADIERFLAQNNNDLDGEFARIFQPDVDVAAFGHTTESFLRYVLELIARQRDAVAGGKPHLHC